MAIDNPRLDNPRLAVLIDADNVPAAIADGLFDEVATLGDASVRRIYGDFAGPHLGKWREVLAAHAINPTQQFAYTKGKNASDITLVIEAMDLLHDGRVDGFCLVSSDSDLTRLASRIREQGLVVYGFGAEKTPDAFVKACTRFIYIENLVGAKPVEAAKPKPRRATKAPEPGPEPEPEPEPGLETGPEAEPGRDDVSPPTRRAPREAVPLILRAMDRVDDEDDWFPVSQVGQVLYKLHPDFDPRSYGSARLSSLIRASGAFEYRKQGGGQFRLVIDPSRRD
jgi:hypothetical protein